MKRVSRRKFFTLAAGAAAAAAAAKAEPAFSPHAPLDSSAEPLGTASAQNTEWDEFKPDITLDCAILSKEIEPGVKANLRAYNGTIPGPLIVSKPGVTLKIRVTNSLPANQSQGWDGNMDVPHDFGNTNLHLHGLDIAPHIFEPLATLNPMAPMIAIEPGEYKDYPFVIPEDQSPGLNWYHPHSHGSTVIQAVSGMAGALIIKGAIDEVPEIKAAKDYLLAVQDLGLFQSNDPKGGYYDYNPKQNAIWQTFGGNVTIYDPVTKKPVVQPDQHCGFTTGDYALRYYLLNGEPFFKETHNNANPTQPTPTVMTPGKYTMRPGEVARFRFLNACSDLMIPLQVEGHDMWLLGIDGNNYDEPRHRPYASGAPQVYLGPANRAEFLIKAGKPGTYNILQLAQTQQFLQADQKTIATIVVEGDEMDMKIPHSLPPITRDPPIKDSEIKERRYFTFSGRFPGVDNPVVGIDFMINNQLYEELATPTVVFLNECEEWHIIVPDAIRGGTEGHPFHIHVNDFEVKSIAGIQQPPGTIQDTIWVAQNTASVIRMRFKQWTGKSVFHCHILPHEETGMMQNFLILPERPMMHATEMRIPKKS
ncbi:MAG TPA: multicopper oxidase family protein [Terracidiphilus sp.]|jgi:FtsP/CotA-like multicopper oxidase with cupredoxin domain|nr:multicopper oxidase family protein [Terracidiphilus sp.]